jgi:hypothetical protein
MQRRTLLASLALLAVSARNVFASNKPQTTSKTSMAQVSLPESVVKLGQGSKFQLPENAIDGMTLFFQPEMGMKSSPSFIIPPPNHKIMGLSEELEIDESMPFAMTFDAQHKSWAISANTIG